MRIAVVGTGYVGLVTGTCFAEVGNEVCCVDIDAAKVKQLQGGNIPIYEPHLEGMFQRNLRQKRLSFTTRLEEAVDAAQVIFLALPTPMGEDGSADLSRVMEVAEHLGRLMKTYKLVVTKSTVPVGTADKLKALIGSYAKAAFDVASNPEFLREGFAVDDFMKPDRVVIGAASEEARKLLGELYAPFVRQGNPVYYMDERSAEMTKYAANSFLATRITFMNEVANLCERVGADVEAVRIGIGADSRIGKRFLFPGIGYGGSCFPKDVQALIRMAEEKQYDFRLLKAVTRANELQKGVLVAKIRDFFKGNLGARQFALWGLAFKPDTDDIREAPSMHLIRELLAEKAKVTAYDPAAMPNAKKLLRQSISFAEDPYVALKDADALLIATEWAQFRTPDFELMLKQMKGKAIFDGRNLYEPETMKKLGFEYFGIGRINHLP